MKIGMGARRIALAITLAAGSVAVLSAPADAHVKKYASTVTLALGTVNGGEDNAWYGNVQSSRAGCRPGRTVTLFRSPSPNPLATGKTTAADAINVDGSYTLYTENAPPPPGDYYVTVARRRIGGTGHRHICTSTRSPDYTVSGG